MSLKNKSKEYYKEKFDELLKFKTDTMDAGSNFVVSITK